MNENKSKVIKCTLGGWWYKNECSLNGVLLKEVKCLDVVLLVDNTML